MHRALATFLPDFLPTHCKARLHFLTSNSVVQDFVTAPLLSRYRLRRMMPNIVELEGYF